MTRFQTLFSLMGLATLLSINHAQAADQQYACTCQTLTVCGADACEPGDALLCKSANITLSSTPPSIKVCHGLQCAEGPAEAAGSSDKDIVLSNELKLEGPDVNPSRVFVHVDRLSAIGSIQTSDEGGPAVYTIICRLPGEK